MNFQPSPDPGRETHLRLGGLPVRSELASRIARGDFWWATGIEDTFISAPHPATGRTLDEYALTDHYARWSEDIGLMAELGVPAARYGLPWYRIEPERGHWNWDWADRPIDRMLELGISPQIDLVHYGLPDWIERAYLDPDYPSLVADYAARVADRFKGRVHWFTPLNEPRVTAWYCGRLGWWPPNLRGWRGFAAVLLPVALGIQKTIAALRQVDPEIVVYHVDATDLCDTHDPALEGEASIRNARVLLPLDLVLGRVGRDHPLASWLQSIGADTSSLELLHDKGQSPDITGLNLYPQYSYHALFRDSRGRIMSRQRYREDGLIERIASGYWKHFGLPLTISEVATWGSIDQRMRWLHGSIAQVRSLRRCGIPLVGYTWWPMYALVPWAWRQGNRELSEMLLQMGLWELDSKLNRTRTPLVDAYASIISKGAKEAGPLERDPGVETDVQELLSRRV